MAGITHGRQPIYNKQGQLLGYFDHAYHPVPTTATTPRLTVAAQLKAAGYCVQCTRPQARCCCAGEIKDTLGLVVEEQRKRGMRA